MMGLCEYKRSERDVPSRGADDAEKKRLPDSAQRHAPRRIDVFHKPLNRPLQVGRDARQSDRSLETLRELFGKAGSNHQSDNRRQGQDYLIGRVPE